MAGVLLQLLGQSGLVARAAYAAGWIGGPAEFPALFQDRYGVGIVLTYVVKETPFVALVALAMLRRAGTELEDVAATLGATAWQRFRHVTLPLIAPPVVAASLIVFSFVFGSFEVPLLLGRPYPAMVGVVAQRRFASTELADRPGAMAAGVLMALLAAVAVWGYLRLSRRLVGERPVLF
jgi:putative spermidine/putrescine transport system permease protein